MPVALPIDQNIVKELWLQGFTPQDIFKRTGVKPVTLRQWIARGEWKREAAVERPIRQEAQKQAYKDVAERLANETIEQVDRILCHIRKLPMKTLNDCKTASTAVAAAYATFRKAANLDGEGGSQHLHLHMMLKPETVPQSPAIDIEAQSI